MGDAPFTETTVNLRVVNTHLSTGECAIEVRAVLPTGEGHPPQELVGEVFGDMFGIALVCLRASVIRDARAKKAMEN